MSTESSRFVTPRGPSMRAFHAPPELPPFAAYAAARVGDPALATSDRELAFLHPAARIGRRRGFVAGRAAAHRALAELGLDDEVIGVGSRREPLWPEGVVGSISHTVDVAVALVAPRSSSGGVGVDVERFRDAPELWDQVPRPEELTWIDGHGDREDRERALFALFSAKETVYKAFSYRVGRPFGFEDASLVPTSSGFAGRLVGDLDTAYPVERTFAIHCEWFGDLVRTWAVLPGE